MERTIFTKVQLNAVVIKENNDTKEKSLYHTSQVKMNTLIPKNIIASVHN